MDDDYLQELQDYFIECANTDHSIDEMIDEAIYFDDIERAKYLLCAGNFADVSQENREKWLFRQSYLAANNRNKGHNVLKYIIFDYNINENNSLDLITNENDKLIIQKMFD